jgi:uncharacterized protein
MREAPMTETRFEELMEFPADFTFRLIARSSAELVGRCEALLVGVLGRPILKVESNVTSSGRWTAVHVSAQVQDAGELRACYAALAGLEGLQMLV